MSRKLGWFGKAARVVGAFGAVHASTACERSNLVRPAHPASSAYGRARASIGPGSSQPPSQATSGVLFCARLKKLSNRIAETSAKELEREPARLSEPEFEGAREMFGERLQADDDSPQRRCAAWVSWNGCVRGQSLRRADRRTASGRQRHCHLRAASTELGHRLWRLTDEREVLHELTPQFEVRS